VIDLGHTRIKWAGMRNGDLLSGSVSSCGVDHASAFDRFLGTGTVGHVWVCAAANDYLKQLEGRLGRHKLCFTRIETGTVDLPVSPAYKTLGADRWLAMQPAWEESRDACCVVDCGTAVTVDLVDRVGHHKGGWIMAGLAALRAGLLTRARGLPRQFKTISDPAQPVCDSGQAVAGGTLLQLIAAIDRAVAASARQVGVAPTVWLTGGDADAIADHLEVRPRRDPWLVLRGLALAAGQA
jgi:type III pantothenate kinase